MTRWRVTRIKKFYFDNQLTTVREKPLDIKYDRFVRTWGFGNDELKSTTRAGM